jgi:hypothetical protein
VSTGIDGIIFATITPFPTMVGPIKPYVPILQILKEWIRRQYSYGSELYLT